MLKVLELIDGGFIGGGQIHIFSICNNLNRDDFIPVIAASPEGKFKELSLSSGYTFYDVDLPKIFKFKPLNIINDIVNAENISIIHAHGGVAGMYAGLYKKSVNRNIKIVHTIHGIHYIHSKSFFRKYISLFIERYLVKWYDAFICVSDDDFITAGKLKLINPLKTSVIHNGINLKRFVTGSVNLELRKEFGFNEDNFVVGNISRFDEQKNQKLLVEILPDLIKYIPSVKLLLVGDGDLMDSVKSLVNELKVDDYVIFTGARNDVDRFYSAFDVFVFPSLWEGLSLTLIEALASGCAIVSSDIPSNRELIRNNVNGLLFGLSNKQNLIENIIALYKDKNLRKTLSENAVKSSESFDEKTMTQKIESVYLKLFNI